MQIALAQPNKDTFSSVLADFQSKFCFDWSEINNNFRRRMPAAETLMRAYNIKELKDMTDFIGGVLSLDIPFPKRNSKAALAAWLAKLVLDLRELAEIEAIACSQKREERMAFYKATAHLPCLNWRLLRSVRRTSANKSLAAPAQSNEGSEAIVDTANFSCASAQEIEVLEPQVYTISIADSIFPADGNYPDELHLALAKMPFYRVSRLPPYLIDQKNNLLKKVWQRNCDAGYAEIVSEHLSNIAVGSGLVIKLMAENLEVYQACIVGEPPPFLIHGGGVYKRDRVKLSLAPRYFQVVSEYLSNIVVV